MPLIHHHVWHGEDFKLSWGQVRRWILAKVLCSHLLRYLMNKIIVLKCQYSGNIHVFSIWAIWKHRQVVCTRRKIPSYFFSNISSLSYKFILKFWTYAKLLGICDGIINSTKFWSNTMKKDTLTANFVSEMCPPNMISTVLLQWEYCRRNKRDSRNIGFSNKFYIFWHQWKAIN